MVFSKWILLTGLGYLGVMIFAPMSRGQTHPGDAAADVKVALPVIPDHKFNIVDFGGVGDGKTINTKAFAKAVAAIHSADGGHLEIPPGTFLTLAFDLTSHIDLHLDAGAVIKTPESLTAWGLPDPASATQDDVNEFARGGVIFGRDLTDVAITGSGTIDGSGALFWIWSDKAARRYPPGRLIYPRPTLVELRGCKRVHVDGITLSNSPMSHLVVSSRSEDILIENVRVFAPSDAPNTDAIDPGGQRIIIRNCEFDTGDDHVAIQGGSRDVVIEDLTCLHGHGISIGSGTLGGVSHVFVRRCTFDGADNGLRIKSYRGRGGEVHDIHYSDITMKNVARPFDINMLYNGNANTPTDVGPRAPQGQSRNIPFFHDIDVTNLTVTRSPIAGRILGLPEQMARDITFTNVKIQADRGFLVQDATNIKFINVKLDVAVGQPITTDNAKVDRE
ncbi:MAG: glycosyl hydrolase family 28 protein [Tepidisphaeraceae bacterium]|jgi:polygalacturonase